MKKIKVAAQVIAITGCLLSILASCKNYYKVAGPAYKNNAETTDGIENLKKKNKTFILRSGTNAFEMKNIVFNNEKTILECTLDTVSDLHQLYLNKSKNWNMRHKAAKPKQNNILNEVHIYVAENTQATAGKYTLALDKIKKVEVIEKDEKRTTKSYITGGIGITLGVAAAAGIALLIAVANMKIL